MPSSSSAAPRPFGAPGAGPTTSRRWDEPEGVEARGTLIVLAGRGETPAAYTRFARRLSADAYRVRVVGDVATPRQRTLALARTLLKEANLSPTVVVGQDAGAIAALQLAAAHPDRIHGVIAIGLPVRRDGVATLGPSLVLRTRSPEHWAHLSDPAVIEPDGLSRELPEQLVVPDPRSISVPVLALHGTDDAVAPLEETRAYLSAIRGARLLAVDRGLHDSLNDAAHRSVAASIVLFLEELRHGAPTVARIDPGTRSFQP